MSEKLLPVPDIEGSGVSSESTYARAPYSVELVPLHGDESAPEEGGGVMEVSEMEVPLCPSATLVIADDGRHGAPFPPTSVPSAFIAALKEPPLNVPGTLPALGRAPGWR